MDRWMWFVGMLLLSLSGLSSDSANSLQNIFIKNEAGEIFTLKMAPTDTVANLENMVSEALKLSNKSKNGLVHRDRWIYGHSQFTIAEAGVKDLDLIQCWTTCGPGQNYWQVFVKDLEGRILTLVVEAKTTAAEFYQLVSRRLGMSWDNDGLRLIGGARGRQIPNDASLLTNSGVIKESTVHAILRIGSKDARPAGLWELQVESSAGQQCTLLVDAVAPIAELHLRAQYAFGLPQDDSFKIGLTLDKKAIPRDGTTVFGAGIRPNDLLQLTIDKLISVAAEVEGS